MRFYKHFRLQIIFRSLLLLLTCLLTAFLAFKTQLHATLFIMGFMIIYQIISLIRYMERLNQNLGRFLMAIQHNDFSQTFSGKGLGSSFDELWHQFNGVMKKFHLTRAEKEEQFRYLQTIVQHVGIGVIVYQTDGKVDLINSAAKRILNIPRLRNINSLNEVSETLVDRLFSLRSGEKTLVKIGNQDMELAIHSVEFRLRDQKFTLVSLQNISSELQEKEMESWQKLIRVLTHEIMNSMTPITSMAATIIDLLDSENESPTHIEDIRQALRTIHKRSQGLTHFVNAYRDLTLIPTPTLKIFSISELFTRITTLMENKIESGNISFVTQVEPESLELTADIDLVEQVLINLILNATEGVKGKSDPRIEMIAGLNPNGKVTIQVKDNGKGIVEEALNKIFVPFFTTRKKGSGIGLNISRQILHLHRGTLKASSIPEKETTFTLEF